MDRCVVFDPDADDAYLRARLAMKAVGILRQRGLAIGDVVSTTSRREVEQLVREGHSLVLLDMNHAPFLGNVGARIARALASDPDTAARTRRIVWTRHSWTTILEGLDGHAHAIVRYVPRDDRVGELADAIAYACAQPDDAPVATRAFPPAEGGRVRRAHLTRALQEALGEVLPGDAEIAEALRHRIPDQRINAMLIHLEGPRRRNVNAFLRAMIDHGSATSLDDARSRVYEDRIMPWTERRVEDVISPEVVEAVAGQLDGLAPAEQEAFARGHGLREDELRIAIAFVATYERRTDGVHGGHGNDARWAAISGALEDTSYLDACRDTGLGEPDLVYALHSIRDQLIDF